MPLDVLKCLLSCLKISWLKIFGWLLVSAFFPYKKYIVNCYMFTQLLKNILARGAFFCLKKTSWLLVGFFACREYLVDYQLDVIVLCVLGLKYVL